MPTEQVEATRVLLHEACALLASQGEDAVLIGGWVPDVRFPTARPSHIGSIDVDMLLRLQQEQHKVVVALLLQNGFRPGQNQYQFLKDVRLGNGRTVTARLDLLTSARHHAKYFSVADTSPQPVHGTDIAFRDNAVLPIGASGEVEIRVAGIAAFLTMKSIALHARERPKDAYDIHYCLEHYPDGIEGLVAQFLSLKDDELVIEGVQKLAAKFRSEEDDGPRMVADVEEAVGDYRAIRKLSVYSRVNEFLTALAVPDSRRQV
jgi:hypothetical protein